VHPSMASLMASPPRDLCPTDFQNMLHGFAAGLGQLSQLYVNSPSDWPDEAAFITKCGRRKSRTPCAATKRQLLIQCRSDRITRQVIR